MGREELGRRLKEARLARKMTQSEVVGNFITRNMLSQIESGTAMPSVKTLEYLSKTLEIPLEQLMADDNREETTLEILLTAKENFNKGHYQEVVQALEKERQPESLLYDEANALLARSFLQLAKKEKEFLNEADGEAAVFETEERLRLYARAAGRCAGSGIYASRELRMEALVLEHMEEEPDH